MSQNLTWIFVSLKCVLIRDGSVGPVSRYREHFTEILWWDFTTATSLISIYNVGTVKILETYPKSEEIIRFYPQFSCICRLYTVLAIVLTLWMNIACGFVPHLYLTILRVFLKKISICSVLTFNQFSQPLYSSSLIKSSSLTYGKSLSVSSICPKQVIGKRGFATASPVSLNLSCAFVYHLFTCLSYLSMYCILAL